MRFEGKRAIVTGAASGIGRAVAQRLAAEGAMVTLCDVNEAGLKETAEGIGGKARAVTLNVGDSAACAKVVADAVAAHGGLDVLCNIAGVLDYGPTAELSDERWLRVLQVNLNGVFFLSRAAVPHLLKTRGNIVNLASAAGLVGVPFAAAYNASKHGCVGLTRSMALELSKQGVRVNAVCPGGVKTPLIAAPPVNKGVDLDMLMRAAGWLDDGEMADPEDIADTVAFLASHEAKRITGVAFAVDGGQTAA